jgi:hypothetical protein
MFLRPVRCTAAAVAAVALMLALTQPSSAQTPLPTPPSAAAQIAPPATTPSSPPAATTQSPPPAATNPGSTQPQTPATIPPEGLTTKPTDAFGEDVTLTAKPIVYVKGSGTWDKAFAIISSSLK